LQRKRKDCEKEEYQKKKVVGELGRTLTPAKKRPLSSKRKEKVKPRNFGGHFYEKGSVKTSKTAMNAATL